MSFLLTLLLNLLIGLVTSDYARRRGKDPFLWFLIGTLLGIFALVILYFLPNDTLRSKPNIAKDEAVELRPPSSFEMHEWHYLIPPNIQHGPIPFSTLKELFTSKKISTSTYVWTETMADWLPIAAIPELLDALRTS